MSRKNKISQEVNGKIKGKSSSSGKKERKGTSNIKKIVERLRDVQFRDACLGEKHLSLVSLSLIPMKVLLDFIGRTELLEG